MKNKRKQIPILFLLLCVVIICFSIRVDAKKKQKITNKSTIKITLKANNKKPGRISLNGVPNKKGTVWYYYKNDPCVKEVDAYANFIDIYPGEYNGTSKIIALRKIKSSKNTTYYDKYKVNITITDGKEWKGELPSEEEKTEESTESQDSTETYKNIGLSDNKKPSSYKKAMVELLSSMNTYAKKKRKEKFNMITNGGYGLYSKSQSKSIQKAFFKAVDGVLIEDVYYGWDTKLNNTTPSSESKKMTSALKNAKKNGKAIFNLEYCTGNKAKKAKKNSKSIGSICYTASKIDLNKISEGGKGNKNNITKLSDVKNYMIVLDPGNYSKKQYLNKLKQTNYDLLFIDMYHNGKALTKKEVNSLKKKKNGKKRLVCTYISVGEAENYRSYWKSSWSKSKPRWMSAENSDWEGNYKVKYWTKSWQKLLYGNSSSYLNKALKAGFDGAYLDVIDAYEYY